MYTNVPNVLSVCLRLNAIDCFEMTYFEIKKIDHAVIGFLLISFEKLMTSPLPSLVSLGSGCSGSVFGSS